MNQYITSTTIINALICRLKPDAKVAKEQQEGKASEQEEEPGSDSDASSHNSEIIECDRDSDPDFVYSDSELEKDDEEEISSHPRYKNSQFSEFSLQFMSYLAAEI